MEVGFSKENIKSHTYLNLRYIGTDTSIMVESPELVDGATLESLFSEAFQRQHQLEFGFNFDHR